MWVHSTTNLVVEKNVLAVGKDSILGSDGSWLTACKLRVKTLLQGLLGSGSLLLFQLAIAEHLSLDELVILAVGLGACVPYFGLRLFGLLLFFLFFRSFLDWRRIPSGRIFLFIGNFLCRTLSAQLDLALFWILGFCLLDLGILLQLLFQCLVNLR